MTMTTTTMISKMGARKRRRRARFAMKRSGSVQTTTAKRHGEKRK